MDHAPQIGDQVVARPAPGLLVSEFDHFLRPLPAEGKVVAWSEWLAKRLADGSIQLVTKE